VGPQAPVIVGPQPPHTPTISISCYFIKMLLNAFRVIVILQPFIFFFINFGPLESGGGPKVLLLLLLCKSGTARDKSSQPG